VTTEFDGSALEVTTYDFYVTAKNWVGTSAVSTTTSYAVTIDTSPSNSVISGDGVTGFEAAVDASVTIQAYDTSNAMVSTGGDFFFITVTNQCAIVDSFYCEQVSGAEDLVGDGIYTQLTDANDGSYDTTYTVSVDGTVTVSAFIAKNGGLYAEYFNNAFLDGVPTSSGIDQSVNFDWGTDLVTAEAADFVSARWMGKVKPSITEEFTFILHADDGVRLYI
jgi:hypothetical protein